MSTRLATLCDTRVKLSDKGLKVIQEKMERTVSRFSLPRVSSADN